MNIEVKSLLREGEICRALVLMFIFCTTAQRISLPPQHAFNSLQPEGGIEMTVTLATTAVSKTVISLYQKRTVDPGDFSKCIVVQ
ncbi:MAG: hypothetical protein IT249_02690 [Chitinophagaceae bacterium]|nr:hypothetical protein [Chitinophagaceae bacterium]